MLDLAACAPNVHPATMAEVIRVESAGNPLAINVNRLVGERQPRPRTVDDAVRAAEVYIARGLSVDLGVAQVNSHNLARLGYTVRQMFDPHLSCTAGATILKGCYARAAQQMGEGQAALRAAFSCYNTGTFHKGFTNGYVARYVPALENRPTQSVSLPQPKPPAASGARRVEPASWGGLVAHGWGDAVPAASVQSAWLHTPAR